MGTRNQERRAASKRKRAAGRPVQGSRPAARERIRMEPPEEDVAGPVRAGLVVAARKVAAGDRRAAVVCAEELLDRKSPARTRVILKTGGALLGEVVAMLWSSGWEPVDVHEVGRRRLGAVPLDLVLDAMADQVARRAVATLDPRWPAQLEEAGARLWWAPDQCRSRPGPRRPGTPARCWPISLTPWPA